MPSRLVNYAVISDSKQVGEKFTGIKYVILDLRV